jgi:4-amino-4-deoxychorismate lyase
MASNDVEIFTSLRYDPQCAEVEPENGPFYMLNYHRDRLLEAAKFFSFKSAVNRFEGEDGLDWLKGRLETEVSEWKKNKESEAQQSPLKVSLFFMKP